MQPYSSEFITNHCTFHGNIVEIFPKILPTLNHSKIRFNPIHSTRKVHVHRYFRKLHAQFTRTTVRLSQSLASDTGSFEQFLKIGGDRGKLATRNFLLTMSHIVSNHQRLLDKSKRSGRQRWVSRCAGLFFFFSLLFLFRNGNMGVDRSVSRPRDSGTRVARACHTSSAKQKI